MLTILRTAALAVAAMMLLAPTPALAQWLRAETDHFIIYGAGSERSLRAYAEKVERFDFFLRTYYPIQVDHEIPLRMARLNRIALGVAATIRRPGRSRRRSRSRHSR